MERCLGRWKGMWVGEWALIWGWDWVGEREWGKGEEGKWVWR